MTYFRKIQEAQERPQVLEEYIRMQCNAMLIYKKVVLNDMFSRHAFHVVPLQILFG